MISVRFVQSAYVSGAGQYSPGDVAGFDEETATFLLASGAAIRQEKDLSMPPADTMIHSAETRRK